MIDYIENNKRVYGILFVMILLLSGILFLNNKNEGVLRTPVRKVSSFNFDNLTWTLSSTTAWGARDSHTVFQFKDKMWVIGGLDANHAIENGEPNYDKAVYYNDIWYTDDGLNWTRAIEHAVFPNIRSTSIFEINGKLFMLGGYSPEKNVQYNFGLWTSLDGINWKKENTVLPWKIREGQQVIKFKDKYLMIGGVNYLTKERFNDIWQSTDGYNWSVLATSTPWEPRWDFEATEFNGKLWLTGGMTSVLKLFGDEWVTDDGINWKLVYKEAPYGMRQGHASIVSDGYMMLIGGILQDNSKDGEVWATRDGINWVGKKYDWIAREDVSAMIFKNRAFILGGMNYNYTWSNDVIYSNFYKFDNETINQDTFKKEDEVPLYKGECPSSTNASTSEELSKIFVNRENRLPEGFIPGDLVELNGVVHTDSDVTCLDRVAAEHLVDMFKQAEKYDIHLGISFGYRTPQKQQEMLDFWIKQSGTKEALEGIAKPYYSEHQLGVGTDLTGKTINYIGVRKDFANTPEAKWLEQNAYLYGYVLSYPEDKIDVTGYIYEPWHWRYVGVDVAKILHDKHINFSEYQKSN